MQCPNCKKDVKKKSLRCEFCGAKIASVCKNCGTINPILSTKCSVCGNELLKICEQCGAANLPNVKYCRKCNYKFVQPNIPKRPEYSSAKTSQQKVKTQLLEYIKNADTSVITIGGESGSGKNLVLRYVMSELKNAKLIWLQGVCTQVTQLSPFGYFQELLLNFFNINNFCPDTLQLKRNSINFFKQDFVTLNNSEILDLLNFLYPEKYDKYENIYHNKAKMFIIMKKVMLTILEKMKAIFIIDGFENIDSMSYDFLNELAKDEFVLTRAKFIIVSSVARPGQGCITSPLITQDNYADLTIAPFTQNQICAMVKQYPGANISDESCTNIYKLSSGNPANAEQILLLYKALEDKNLKIHNYISLESIIEARLLILKEEQFRSYRLLMAMAILGYKFCPAMLSGFDNLSNEELEKVLDILTQQGYITQMSNLAYEFKSVSIWKIIVNIMKNDEIFINILNSIYKILSFYKHSSIAILGYIVQKLNNSATAFDIWTQLMKQATYIGDISLYVIAQQQALKLIEKNTDPHSTKIKKNIYTRIGKLLEPIDHKSSFEYLQNAIQMLNENDEYEYIELVGYLASSSMKAGNYWGAIECINNVLSKVPIEMELERTLIKSRQIHPLTKLGNYGQCINLIDTSIMSVFEKYLSKGKNTSIISMPDLYNVWLEIYFDFAESLTLQGDNRMFDVIKLIFEILEKNKTTEPALLCRVHLALALANTIKGDIQTSMKILDDMLKEFSLDSMDSFIVSRWNFIDIINKFLTEDYSSMQNELFNVVSYANNINDNFTKNILKTLLAKMFCDKSDYKKALEILEEQVSYFAKEKMSTGVLLSWYLIAKTRLITNGTQFALDIATKALDIAQGPNINNYFFIVMFNKLIGEIYIAKQDFESAKVYIEKAIVLSKQFNLELLLTKCYILYAKFYHELALPKSINRINYIKHAFKMFQMAKSSSIVSTNPFIQKRIKDELTTLTYFCKMNKITLKKATR